MKNMGKFDAGMITPQSLGFKATPSAPIRTTDAQIQNTGAFLASELEKRDNLIREPLKSVTYPRDIPVKVGGGWVETVSSLSVDYGVTSARDDSEVTASGANLIPVIQANLDKELYMAHEYAIAMRIKYVDMQRSAITGRSLDQMLTRGIRLAYDKHMDLNVYLGITRYGTYGLLNNPNVEANNVPAGTSGTTTWATKTPDEVLADINTAINEAWAASNYDLSAMPNHILLPYEQYNYIATNKVGDNGDMTILTFLEENNIARKNGTNLFIGATAYGKGAGEDDTDRMVVYVNDDLFVAVEELVPMNRVMTGVNLDAVAYDSIFMANISQAEMFYTQPIRYYDGI